MRLRNKNNGRIYKVRTETDNFGGFMIYAVDSNFNDNQNFVMHYRTLEEFCNEWEDA